MTIAAAADGSALGNPGPAGWAWYVDEHRWSSGGWPHGTNNMGELTAVLELLRSTAEIEEDLLVYCDSRYAINTITEWMPGWKARGWRKRDGKPVLNLGIVQALDEAMVGRRVRFEWVKGHAGHPLNEAADRLANAAATAFKQGAEPDPGPGFGAGIGSLAVDDEQADPQVTDTVAAEAEEYLFGDLGTGDDGIEHADSGVDRVVALERSLLTDAVRADAAEVAALLHEDWCEVGRSGRLWTRDEMVAAIGPLPEPVDLEVVDARELRPGIVLLVWRAISAETSTLRSSLWVLDRGDWRQMFHQGTRES